MVFGKNAVQIEHLKISDFGHQRWHEVFELSFESNRSGMSKSMLPYSKNSFEEIRENQMSIKLKVEFDYKYVNVIYKLQYNYKLILSTCSNQPSEYR